MAAFTHDHKWITHPIRKIQAMPAPIKKIIAANHRPCTNWPNPGHRKLHNAAITFPADPCPSLMRATIAAPAATGQANPKHCNAGLDLSNSRKSNSMMPQFRRTPVQDFLSMS